MTKLTAKKLFGVQHGNFYYYAKRIYAAGGVATTRTT